MRMMSGASDTRGLMGYRLWMILALGALTIALPACHHATVAGEPARGQKTFSTPEEAGLAVALAAKNDNQPQMLAIFGAPVLDQIPGCVEARVVIKETDPEGRQRKQVRQRS